MHLSALKHLAHWRGVGGVDWALVLHVHVTLKHSS